MASPSLAQEPGGFLRPTLPSPPSSSVNSPTPARPLLPHPRSKPLRPGSSKESELIDYVEQKLLAVSRRFENRFSVALSGEEDNPDIEGRGYKDIGEQLRDLDPVFDVVWVSGTPFSSLLKGASVETGQPLPGFDGGIGRLSTTEKVRMRGIVERTRVALVEVAGKEESLADVKSTSLTETDTEDDFSMTADDDDVENLEDESSHRRWEMDIARVYERTIVELGMALDASPIGNDG
ncbi:MAG: hypothetical protein Q9208_005010 [Pyrenodesmia sp. 3 TL-2023]